MNAIKNAITQDAKDAIREHELRVIVLQKIVNSMTATDDLGDWLRNAKITGVTGLKLSLGERYLVASIDGDNDFIVGVKVSNSKDEMIDYAKKEMGFYLQEIERNKERLKYSEQIAERVARHVKNIKKELEGLNALSFEHGLILSLVAPGRNIL